MATITLGGKPCADPKNLLQRCQQLGLPTDAWLGAANSFRCPLGAEAGRGWLLMAARDVDALAANSLHDLVFKLRKSETAGKDPHQDHTVTLKNLILVRHQSVTPGLRGDDHEHRLAEVADRRLMYRHIPIDTAYNVRDVPTATYYAGTLNVGVAWTWAEVGQSLWEAVGTGKLGAWPGLPFTPDGTPGDLRFYGGSAWLALDYFLRLIGCAVKYNPLTDAFSVVRIGATDAFYDAALTAWDSWRVWDADWSESSRGRIPENARVLFRKLPPPAGASPWYVLTVADPTAFAVTGEETGTTVDFHDEMVAVYNTAGTITNAAALATRATDRATGYFTALHNGWSRLRRRYALPLAETGFLPGSRVRLTTWMDTGGGLQTEVLRFADDLGIALRELGTQNPPGTTTRNDFFLEEVFTSSYEHQYNQSLHTYDATLYNLTVTNNISQPAGSIWSLTQSSTQSLTADVNNLTVTGPVVVWSGNDLWTVTGIVAPSPATGQMLFVYNGGTYPILLPHQSGSSTAANQFDWYTDQTVVFAPDTWLMLRYNTALSRWNLIEYCKPTVGISPTPITLAGVPIQPLKLVGVKPPVLPLNPNGAPRDLPGIVGGVPGMIWVLENRGPTDRITLKHNDGGTTAADRFALANGRDRVLDPYERVGVIYDGNQLRWVEYPGGKSAEMVGDSGSGGYSGSVPAPAAGDAAAFKALLADGTWGEPAATVAGLTPTLVLYAHSDGTVRQDASFSYIEADNLLWVGEDGTGQVLIGDNVASQIDLEASTSAVVTLSSPGGVSKFIAYRSAAGANLSNGNIVFQEHHQGRANGTDNDLAYIETTYQGDGTTILGRVSYKVNTGAGLVSVLELMETGKVRVPPLTASKFVKTDASKDLVSADIVVADLPTGTSGNTVPLLDGANTWSAVQQINASLSIVSAVPLIWLKDTSVADTGFFIYAETAFLRFTQATDAGGVGTTHLVIDRASGNVGVGNLALPSGGGTPVLALAQASGDPTGVSSNTACLFAKDDGGTCKLYGINEAGTVDKLSGFGTAAYKNTGTSGNTVPLLDGANTWSAAQTITVSTATFPGGFSDNLKLVGGAPTLWLHDSESDDGWLLGSDGGALYVFYETSGSVGGYQVVLGSAGMGIGTSAAPTDAKLQVAGTDAADFVLTVQGFASQSANLQEWRKSDGTVYGTVSENGYFTTRKNAAPADAELVAGELAHWFDATNGAARVEFKGKTADGTAVNITVADLDGANTWTADQAITKTVDGVTQLTITNPSNGVNAFAMCRVVNDAGGVGYLGISNTNFAGFAPLNGGRAFWLSLGCPAVFGSQTDHMTIFTRNGYEIARFDISSQFGLGVASPGAKLHVAGDTAANITVIFQGAASQSANLQEWQKSDGTIYGTYSENGYWTTRKTTAPADAELTASELAIWLDDTNGAGKVMFKAKTANGTVVTGNVPLT